MSDLCNIDLSSVVVEEQPFRHFSSHPFFQNSFDLQLFDWFESTDEWNLTETDFYEQYELNFLNVTLPNHLQFLINESMVELIKEKFKSMFNIKSFQLVGVVAHKLISGQHIGIHNDFINEDETHRLVIHINPGWTEENGGFLILFNSSKADDISKIFNPINNSVFGFEISRRSNHAVSKIYDYTRYSIIYTFRKL